MHEQRDHRQLHFPRADLAPKIFGRAADHLSGEEHADDEEQQQVDHADALAAEHAVHPHADHRRYAGERIEAVHLGVDRAASDVGGDRRESGAGGRPEAQFLALEIAEMLIDRQRGDWPGWHVDLAVRRRGIGDLIGRAGMRGEARIRLHRVEDHDPDDEPDHHRQHHAVDDDRVADPAEHAPVHQHQRERKNHHRQRGEEVRRRRRVLQRMGGVHAVEAAAVGAEHLDRDDGRDRADDDRLRLRLALVVKAHRARLEGGRDLGAGVGHRHALLHEDDAEDERRPAHRCTWRRATYRRRNCRPSPRRGRRG